VDEQPVSFLDDRSLPSQAPSRTEERVSGDDVPLLIDEDDRYSRLRLIPWWRQDRLQTAKVLVVGAGALGNEVLKNLALLGVGRVTVIDFDTIEPSNLSRSVLFRQSDGGQLKAEVAARRAREINPEVEIVAIKGDVITDLGLGTFADSDVVIGCLDNREARLWVNRQCWKVGTPWVDAGIQEIQGVVKVFVPPDSACYECAMTERDYQLLNLRYSCPLLRREDMLAGRVPTAPTIASMMAGLQVQEALKLLHGLPVAAGCAFVFNGVSNQFYTTQLPFRADCLSHETYPEPTPLGLGHGDTLADLFTEASRHLEGPLTLVLDRDLLAALECPRCGWHMEVFRPTSRVSQGEAACPNCREPARPEIVSAVAEGSALVTRSLAALGIPPYDIVRVDGATDSAFFLLKGDRTDT
jgi:molybdopterin-synthase adenylyltransferase